MDSEWGTVIPVHALESSKEHREILADADVVLARDVTDHEKRGVLYGREVLQRIMSSGEGRALRVATVELDWEGPPDGCVELKSAIAAVATIKHLDLKQMHKWGWRGPSQ